MRAIILLLVLLFSMCGAQTQNTQTEVQTESQSTGPVAAATAAEVTTELDVSAELRELRDMVVELRVLLTVTQNELQNTKAELLDKIEAESAEVVNVKSRLAVSEHEVKNLKMGNAAVLTRLTASETEVLTLKMEDAAQDTELTAVKTEIKNLIEVNSVQKTELAALMTRLAASETEVVNLRNETAGQTADLRSVTDRVADIETDMEHVKRDTAAQHKDLTTIKTEVENLSMENAAQEAELTAVKTRLAATKSDVTNLETEITEQPKVAFSAALGISGYIENPSVSHDLNLVFHSIITNVGQAYSSITGFFTAPVKGVYYFRFTVMDLLDGHHMKIKMFKNSQAIMVLTERDSDGNFTYLSGGVALQLEVGDVVNLKLPAYGHRLYDNSHNHNIFTGFFLFRL